MPWWVDPVPSLGHGDRPEPAAPAGLWTTDRPVDNDLIKVPSARAEGPWGAGLRLSMIEIASRSAQPGRVPEGRRLGMELINREKGQR